MFEEYARLYAVGALWARETLLGERALLNTVTIIWVGAQVWNSLTEPSSNWEWRQLMLRLSADNHSRVTQCFEGTRAPTCISAPMPIPLPLILWIPSLSQGLKISLLTLRELLRYLGDQYWSERREER